MTTELMLILAAIGAMYLIMNVLRRKYLVPAGLNTFVKHAAAAVLFVMLFRNMIDTKNYLALDNIALAALVGYCIYKAAASLKMAR